MKIRMGTLRQLLREEAMVPGRWYGGEEPEGYDRERVGDPLGMDETDDRMENDGSGNGFVADDEGDNEKIADHLRTDDDNPALGSPSEEEMIGSIGDDLGENLIVPRWMLDELRSFFLQEDEAGTSLADPTDVRGFYTPFDMTKDHTGTDNPNSTWYRSPGREPGSEGDPFRVSDPYARLGFHAPAGPNDPTASPPATDGEAARLAPPIWQLSAGSDTSKVLGANAKGDSGEVGLEGEPSEEDAEGGESEEGADVGTPEGEEPR